MKKINFALKFSYCIVITLIFISFASETLAEKKKSTVLIDFSEENNVRGSVYPKEKLKELLKYIGVKKYLTGDSQCKKDDLETILFEGASSYEGRFIPGPANQKLISISLSRCNQPYWYYEPYLVLEVAGRYIKKIKNGCTIRMKKITEPDEKFLQRVITSCVTAKQGYIELYARLYGFQEKQFKQIKDFGMVYWDNCGAAEKGEERVSVIFDKGKGRFLTKNYKRSCDSQDKGIKDYTFLFNGQLKDIYSE